MQAKAFLRQALAVLICTTLFTSCGRQRSDTASNLIKIGVILPLTGEAASYGVDCQKGIELALESSGNQKPNIQLIFEDSKAEPRQAVAAIQKLISFDKVGAIIGDMFSATTLAIAPIAQASGVLLLTPTASERGIAATGDRIFSIYPPADAEGGVMAAYLPENELGSIVTIRQNLEVFNAIEKGFREGISKRGGTVVASEVLPPDVTAYKNLASRLSTLKPAALYVAGYKDEAARIISACRDAGLQCPTYSQSTLLDDRIVKDYQQALQGTVFTGPAFSAHSNNPQIHAFQSAYRQKFGVPPTVWSAYGHDAMAMLLRSINLAETENKSFHQTLAGMSFDGLTGQTILMPDRTAQKQMVLYRVQDGNIVTLNEEKR